MSRLRLPSGLRQWFVFTAAVLLILGVDIAIASLIYRLARIWW